MNNTVTKAHQRIAPYIKETPLLHSTTLNKWLGHEIIFKAEGYQYSSAFKVRGALNSLLALNEQNSLPRSITTFSSGNHGQAVAWAGRMLGIDDITVFMAKDSSAIKQQSTRDYGGKVILAEHRKHAVELNKAREASGAYFLHPFDHPYVITGQGTACFEALKKGITPDAIFTPCGGGGLVSGTYLAKEELLPQCKIFAGEPKCANDAAISKRQGHIHRFSETPNTIADGVRSLSISPRTFSYIQKIDDIFEIEEDMIIYWCQWLSHLLKITCEPSSSLAMAAAAYWLSKQKTKKQVLVILSGANVDQQTQQAIWKKDFLYQSSPSAFFD